jgi:preprotein translocase subunit SecF
MIHFLKFKWLYLLISAIVIVVGVYSLISAPLDYSIDFTGGSNIQYRYGGELSKEKLTKEFKDHKIEVMSLSETQAKTYLLKTSPVDEKTEAEIRQKLASDPEVKSVDQLRFETVGPSLGKETIKKTAIASAVAILGILIYVTFTFKKLSYGLSAVLAMIHSCTIHNFYTSTNCLI